MADGPLLIADFGRLSNTGRLMTQAAITVVQADLSREDHQQATLHLLNEYSSDPMGDGKPLSDVARRDVIAGLQNHPTTLVFLAFMEKEPVGLAICFLGFSTFAARPLINIHDFYVVPKYRGTGISRRLMAAVEQRGREVGCCKLTLEVMENNLRARGLYATLGFRQLTYSPEAGGALFFTKGL
jgi:GNAT superfamily N-acetyltransferase